MAARLIGPPCWRKTQRSTVRPGAVNYDARYERRVRCGTPLVRVLTSGPGEGERRPDYKEKPSPEKIVSATPLRTATTSSHAFSYIPAASTISGCESLSTSLISSRDQLVPRGTSASSTWHADCRTGLTREDASTATITSQDV